MLIIYFSFKLVLLLKMIGPNISFVSDLACAVAKACIRAQRCKQDGGHHMTGALVFADRLTENRECVYHR